MIVVIIMPLTRHGEVCAVSKTFILFRNNFLGVQTYFCVNDITLRIWQHCLFVFFTRCYFQKIVLALGYN